MKFEEIKRLHQKYASNEEDFEVVFTHCQIVAEIAEWCADNIDIEVDSELLRTACLLHDIGSYPYLAAWEVRPDYRRWYNQHAILGARLLQGEGVDKRICDLVETHILMGLTKKDIVSMDIRIPAKDYVPETIEGRILCYADRYHSKPSFNNFKSFYDKLLVTLPEQARKFKEESEFFGIPNVEKLANKYSYPIR